MEIPKQLPMPTGQIPIPPVQQPIQAFKSSLNKQRDRDSQIVHIQNKVPIKLEANTSIFAIVDYKHDYGQVVPFIQYNIVCADNEFQLCHYIRDVTPKSFTLCISNEATQPRELIVNYKITQC